MQVWSLNKLRDKATFDYTITMSVPDTVRDGDTVALQTRNMSDILDAGETSRPVMVDNVIVGRIERTGYFSKAARQAEVDETLVQKEKASLKAGYADCDYVITFNTNAAKARGKEISFSVNRTEPGTLVSKDTDVTAEVKINRKLTALPIFPFSCQAIFYKSVRKVTSKKLC